MKLQNFSYHTHTDFSDGKNTIEEMLEQAVKVGFSEIGITDHLTFHKNSIHKDILYKNSYTDVQTRRTELNDRIAHIRKISKNYPIKTYIGFEVDFFTYDGWIEGLQELLIGLDYDYLISGTHYTEDGENIVSVFSIKDYAPEKQITLIKKYFDNIKKAIESGIFTFIAHLDFIRWTGICGVDSFKEERMAIIEALAATNTPYELNTKGVRYIGDFYPAKWMIEELNKRDVPIVISDDAHGIDQMGLYFDKAEELLQELNYTNRWKIK